MYFQAPTYYENPEDDPDFDPWELPELKINTTPWSGRLDLPDHVIMIIFVLV